MSTYEGSVKLMSTCKGSVKLMSSCKGRVKLMSASQCVICGFMFQGCWSDKHQQERSIL